MTRLTALIAKLRCGKISRREFSGRVAGLGFGAVTAESILDHAVLGQSHSSGPLFEPFSHKTPYEQWMSRESIPVHTGYYIADVRKLELRHWERMGAHGALIDLEGAEGTDGAYVIEIAPGASTKAQRYLFEEALYVLDGEGETQISQAGGRQSFRWRKGSMFSPPLNCWRQHFNHGHRPARLIAFHDLPLMMDVLHSADFIFHNDFVFRDRYDGQSGYFTWDKSKIRSGGTAAMFGEGERGSALMAETGLIPDVNNLPLVEAKSRGLKNRGIEMVFSDNTMQTHISEFAAGSYKRAHRHGPGSHVFVLGGAGYTLMWNDDTQYSRARKHMRIDWTDGTLLVPPDRWFHQHFNTGHAPAKYMATTWIGGKYFAKAMGGGGRTHRLNTVNVKDGGNMIDYPDEDPVVRAMFEEELKKSGVENQMPERRRKS